jgi:hypothetical protein
LRRASGKAVTGTPTDVVRNAAAVALQAAADEAVPTGGSGAGGERLSGSDSLLPDKGV